MERETTGIRRADARRQQSYLDRRLSVAGSQSRPGHQTLAIANIAAGWIVILTRHRQVRVRGVASLEPDLGLLVAGLTGSRRPTRAARARPAGGGIEGILAKSYGLYGQP